ncbi:MAG: fasciclin domain-containing protein [Verrucomicrobiota bacterium JB023]|nr:fasciclin domain-containing protein [Verrucomicrobiota bacterium JB023]
MKTTITLLTSATLLFSGAAFANHHGEKHEMTEEKAMMEKNLVEIAASNEDFSTLVAAVKAAGLAEALSGEGPFTIFAPTNAAFEKLPEGTVDELLKPENKEKLTSILKYHVVSAKVLAKDVAAGEVETLEGSELTISTDEGSVMVDEAKVVKTDIEGSNGVIHVIDSVIMPSED